MSETIAAECERLKFELIQTREELAKQTELHRFASARADDYARQVVELERPRTIEELRELLAAAKDWVCPACAWPTEHEPELKNLRAGIEAAKVEFDTQAKEREYLGELLTAAVEALGHPGSLGAKLTIPKMEQAAEMLDPNNKRASFRLVDFVVKPGLIESRTRATKHWALKVFADSFHDSLCDAPNYLETRFTTAKGPLVVTIKRELGYTPNEMQLYAEKKLEALRGAVTTAMRSFAMGELTVGRIDQELDSALNAALKPMPPKEQPTNDECGPGENQKDPG